MLNFILEIYSEEIPAKLQLEAIDNLINLVTKNFADHNISFNNQQGFVSPRRLTVILENIPAFTDEQFVEIKGPKIDADQSAIDGFLKSNNLNKQDLVIKEIKNHQFYFYNKIIPKIDTKEIIAGIIPQILQNFPWKRSQKWGENQIRWIRPIQNILCLLGDQIIKFNFGHIISNNISYGHKFMTPGKFIVLDVEQYKNELIARNVIFDQLKRKDEIISQCEKKCSENQLEFVKDLKLLDEVTGLVEFPNALMGNIKDEYMQLPEEVLITSMRVHQKYFSIKKDGKLSNKFITIANVKTPNDNKIIEGNEKVLSARLDDALYFWSTDLKKPLIDRVDNLKNVMYHQKLGTIYDKLVRMHKIALYIAKNYINYDLDLLKRAVFLSKADLVTEMVGEFPDLQGIIGKYYAIKQQENIEVANAIEEHYQPVGAGDDCPTSKLSVILSLADKFDSLVSLWIAGEKPTGSKDPYALRRNALAIIRILIANKISLNLKDLVKYCVSNYESEGIEIEIIDFIKNRFIVYIKSENYPQDVIKATSFNFDDIYLNYLKIQDITRALSSEQSKLFIKSYLRSSNIVNAENKKQNLDLDCDIDQKLLVKEEEKTLYQIYVKLEPQIRKSITEHKYYDAISAFVEIKDPIENFFNNVTVNDEDNQVKINRLRLLKSIQKTLEKLADFSELNI